MKAYGYEKGDQVTFTRRVRVRHSPLVIQPGTLGEVTATTEECVTVTTRHLAGSSQRVAVNLRPEGSAGEADGPLAAIKFRMRSSDSCGEPDPNRADFYGRSDSFIESADPDQDGRLRRAFPKLDLGGCPPS